VIGSHPPPLKSVDQMNAAELSLLKSQLRQTMQQMSERHKTLATMAEQRAIVPQTVAQVDALEQKLKEALEELRARRAELQKQAETKGKTTDKEGKAENRAKGKK
jgi:hypothetical protein